MCCNGIIVLLALIVGFGAIVYLLYQVYSYIKCGCGKYGPFVSSYGKIKDDIIDEARKILKKSKKPFCTQARNPLTFQEINFII